MKRILAAAVLMALTSVHAEELKFGDLNYFLTHGQFNLTADANIHDDKYTSAGTTRRSEAQHLETRFAYGLTSKLNVFAALDYVYKANVNTGGNRFRQDGLANPMLGGNYRAMNQNNGDSVNLDFGLVANVNVEDAKKGATFKDGNAATGRNAVELNSKVGHKWDEANEWRLGAGVIYNFEGDRKDLSDVTSNSDIKEMSSIDGYLQAAYQYRPVNEFMMALSVKGTHVGQYREKNKTSDAKTKYDSHIDLDFGFQAKYLLTSNLIARFNYGVSNNPNYDGMTDGTEFSINQRQKQLMGLGVDWLF